MKCKIGSVRYWNAYQIMEHYPVLKDMNIEFHQSGGYYQSTEIIINVNSLDELDEVIGCCNSGIIISKNTDKDYIDWNVTIYDDYME